MKEKNRLDIVVVSYNVLHLLKRLVESIKAYTLLPYTLTIVDNHSTESGVTEYLLKLSAKEGVNVILNMDNLGYAVATNQGAKSDQSDYLCVFNNDVEILTKGWEKQAIDFMERSLSVGVVGFKLIGDDGLGKGCGADFNWHLRGWGKFEEYVDRKYNAPNLVLYVGGSAFFVKRNLWNRLGGFDERFHFYNEDADFSFRARKLGFETWYLPIKMKHTHEGCLGTSEESSRTTRNKHFRDSLELWKKLYPKERGYS